MLHNYADTHYANLKGNDEINSSYIRTYVCVVCRLFLKRKISHEKEVCTDETVVIE